MDLETMRKRKGLSQRALAEKAGLSRHTVFQVENGIREPQGRTLHKLAAALDTTVTDTYEAWRESRKGE